MDLTFLAQADAATLILEKAKRALEAAKAELETAKRNYDDLLEQADKSGIPKAKLKKIVEDRIQLLFESGLITDGKSAVKEPKPKKRVTEKKAADPLDEKFADNLAENIPPSEVVSVEAEL